MVTPGCDRPRPSEAVRCLMGARLYCTSARAHHHHRIDTKPPHITSHIVTHICGSPWMRRDHHVGQKGGKKPRVFSRLKCHECHRLPGGSLCEAFKTARMGTCVHAHPSISVYPSARPSAFSVRPFVPSVRPSVRAHLVAWPGLFTSTTVALRGSWR